MAGNTTAVIVNYRQYPLLEECVRSLLSSSLPPAEIVVVDNGCEPGRLTQLEARYAGRIRTIANEGNPGYAAACNSGWSGVESEFVLFLNADVTVGRETLASCLDAAGSDPAIGIVSCRLLRPDGSLDHACHRGMPTLLAALAYSLRLDRLVPRSRRLARYRMAWLDTATVHDVEACSGAFMLVRRSLLEQLGGWNDRYWFYAEDVDLCARARAAGYAIRYVGTATATHVKGASSLLRRPRRELSRTDVAHRRRVQRAIVDSHRLFFREHLMAGTPRAISAIVLGLFAVQRARVELASRLDALRPG